MFGSIKSQLRSVVQWMPSNEAVFELWTTNGDELKNASKLIVGPGQGCVFVYEGKVQAVLTQPGITELKTQNIPFWTTITKFMQALESEHKVGLYFFKTTQLVNLKWGTPSVVKYEDPKYKFPVGLRAFGNFSVQVDQPEWFFTSVVGVDELYTITELRELFTSRIIQPMTDVFAKAKFTYAEIDSRRNELALTLAKALDDEFSRLGFRMVDFRIEGTSFDDDTMKRINRIANVSAESQAAQTAGLNFAQLQQLEALRDAAKNPGGTGAFVGMGVGLGMGQQLGGMMGGGFAGQTEDAATRLKKLGELFNQNLITKDEFEAKKKEILGAL